MGFRLYMYYIYIMASGTVYVFRVWNLGFIYVTCTLGLPVQLISV